MKKTVRSLTFLAVLSIILGLALSATAQSSSQQAPPDAQAQSPNPQPPSPGQSAQPSTPAQAPEQAAPPATNSTTNTDSATATGSQPFTGTIVKAGDKYMFQEEGTGKTYDIDHQDQVQKFEGKRVKVHGALDPDGKTIHLQ
ncbi:MAG: hypothetical protein WBX38_03255 [Candidatus Sulfotelmatobacter sp.]